MHTSAPNERSAARRALVVARALNGIDWIEVVDSTAPTGVPRQRTVLVHLFRDVPADFTRDHVHVDGGVRVPVSVQWAFPAASFHDGNVPVEVVSAAEAALLKTWLDGTYAADRTRILVVRTGSGTQDFEGDTSVYRLTLVPHAREAEFDAKFRAIELSFKVECPKPFDCLAPAECPLEVAAPSRIDYLAKDYGGFRRLMLDRLSAVMPAWSDRQAADVGMVVVEAVAYAADHLSYYQDAVATEAYLGTARRRVSVRRHARMLDYRMHDGTSARAYLAIASKAPDGTVVPRGLAVESAADAADAVRFQTKHAVRLARAHNQIELYAWGSEHWWLEAGATAATLIEESTTRPLMLAAGDLLVLEEVKAPATGFAIDADPAHRHAVRLLTVAPVAVDGLTGVRYVEVTWHPDDALPFPLCVADRGPEVSSVAITGVTVARGNIALADHGASWSDKLAAPPVSEAARRYRPALSRGDLTHAEPYDHAVAGHESAAAALRQDPRAALAVVTLTGDVQPWEARFDLLSSGSDDRHFVVEVENDGLATLRFGDGRDGRQPTVVMTADYRIGNGPVGNVAADTLVKVIADTGIDTSGIEHVRNPLPAQGGTAPESIEEVRLYAPQAFRRQERAVTPEDYATLAERYRDVQRAVATRRWTGSWDTIFLTVDRLGGARVDPDFEDELRRYLERYRLAGQDLEIEGPIDVPLEIVMAVCVAPGYFRGDVRRALLDVFSRADLAGGRRGFFHPDNFSFGQPVYLSDVIATAMRVPGVVDVDLGTGDPRNRFQRFGLPDRGERAAARIELGRLEIARLDNSVDRPERGRIDFNLEGGL